MNIGWIDWLIIVAFLILSFAISLRSRKAATKGLKGFFLGGGNLPWLLSGVSMVATTFAADTPLAVTELVAKNGIAGNWLWWNFLIGGLLTTIFFARLWRRSGVLTEVEFIHLRYSGKIAKFLRGFKSVYLGLVFNALVIGWVNLAFIKLIVVFFEVSQTDAILISAGVMLFVAIYSAIAGLRGIVITDVVQFILAMSGCIILAVIVLNSDKIGGSKGLVEQLPPGALDFFPKISETSIAGTLTMTATSFFASIGMLWWTSWYPGAEPGGGGYIAQRMMASENEESAVKATMFFQFAHYCLRPWPWIIVGLCAMVLYPELSTDDKGLGFVLAIRDYMPTGLRGLLLVAFLGAYMSTISTQLNWGASYLVNDLILPFREKKGQTSTDKDIVRMSRLVTIILMIVGVLVSSQFSTVSGIWELILQGGAGIGVVLIFRWFWWRINAWTEIAATVTPFIAYAYIMYKKASIVEVPAEAPWFFDFGNGVIFSLVITLIVASIVTLISKPDSEEKLTSFFNKVKPMGWWGRYGRSDNKSVPWLLLSWITAVVMVYGLLFLTGEMILFGLTKTAGVYLISALLALSLFALSAKRGKLFGWHGN